MKYNYINYDNNQYSHQYQLFTKDKMCTIDIIPYGNIETEKIVELEKLIEELKTKNKLHLEIIGASINYDFAEE